MGRQLLALGLTAISLGSLASAAPAPAADLGPDTPRAAAARFYGALNAMFQGNSAPMQAIWSHRDDVTYMGPQGGILVGWPQVQREWARQAGLRLGGKVDPQEMRINAGSDLAVVSNLEAGENVVNGTTRQVTIRATNVFRKEQGEWRMIGHHTDPLPYLGK